LHLLAEYFCWKLIVRLLDNRKTLCDVAHMCGSFIFWPLWGVGWGVGVCVCGGGEGGGYNFYFLLLNLWMAPFLNYGSQGCQGSGLAELVARPTTDPLAPYSGSDTGGYPEGRQEIKNKTLLSKMYLQGPNRGQNLLQGNLRGRRKFLTTKTRMNSPMKRLQTNTVTVRIPD
jgi:hypothetical protein